MEKQNPKQCFDWIHGLCWTCLLTSPLICSTFAPWCQRHHFPFYICLLWTCRLPFLPWLFSFSQCIAPFLHLSSCHSITTAFHSPTENLNCLCFPSHLISSCICFSLLFHPSVSLSLSHSSFFSLKYSYGFYFEKTHFQSSLACFSWSGHSQTCSVTEEKQFSEVDISKWLSQYVCCISVFGKQREKYYLLNCFFLPVFKCISLVWSSFRDQLSMNLHLFVLQ